MRVTQNDIAKRLGITRTTVARALNNTGFVSEDLKQKILRTAEEMHYKVNVHAKYLKQEQHFRVDVFLMEHYEITFRNELVSGMERVLQEVAVYGLELKIHMLRSVSAEEQGRDMDEILKDQATQGILFIPINSIGLGGHVQRWRKNGILVGTLELPLEDAMCDFHVGPDYFKSGRVAGGMMLKLLCDQGKIIVLSPGKAYKTIYQRQQGFEDRLLGQPYEIVRIGINLKDPSLYTHVRRALQEHPDTVGVYSAIMSQGITRATADAGRGDVIILSNDLTPETEEDLRNGRVQCVIYHRPAFQGLLAVKTMYTRLAATRGMEPQVYETYTDIIIQENMENFQSANGLLL